jgi:hypothetical protein
MVALDEGEHHPGWHKKRFIMDEAKPIGFIVTGKNYFLLVQSKIIYNHA